MFYYLAEICANTERNIGPGLHHPLESLTRRRQHTRWIRREDGRAPPSGPRYVNNTYTFPQFLFFFSFFREINIFGHTNGPRHWLYITCFNLEPVLCFRAAPRRPLPPSHSHSQLQPHSRTLSYDICAVFMYKKYTKYNSEKNARHDLYRFLYKVFCYKWFLWHIKCQSKVLYRWISQNEALCGSQIDSQLSQVILHCLQPVRTVRFLKRSRGVFFTILIGFNCHIMVHAWQ